MFSILYLYKINLTWLIFLYLNFFKGANISNVNL